MNTNLNRTDVKTHDFSDATLAEKLGLISAAIAAVCEHLIDLDKGQLDRQRVGQTAHTMGLLSEHELQGSEREPHPDHDW